MGHAAASRRLLVAIQGSRRRVPREGVPHHGGDFADRQRGGMECCHWQRGLALGAWFPEEVVRQVYDANTGSNLPI